MGLNLNNLSIDSLKQQAASADKSKGVDAVVNNLNDVRSRNEPGVSQFLTDNFGQKIGGQASSAINSADFAKTLNDPNNPVGKFVAGQQPVGYVNQSGEFVDTRLSQNLDTTPFETKSQETRQEVDPSSSVETGKSSTSTSGTPGDEQVSNKPMMYYVPIEYYLTGAEVYLPAPKEGFFGVPIEQIKNVRAEYNPYFYIVDSSEKRNYMRNYAENGFYDGSSDPDFGFRYNLEDDQSLNAITENSKNFNITPQENEDPLFTSFEIRIKRETSPLFNGEAFAFLRRFSPGFNTELSSRIAVLKEFSEQMERFFKFDISPKIPTWAQDESSIFATPTSKKRYYVKKITGLDKLTESNTANTLSSFVKYRSDLITLSFQEDTSLSMATMLSLYKQLYWSRLNGKGMLPENILRFDCEIIVSEVRNLTRIVKDVYQGKNVLRTLHDNVSRHVYDVYECQFFVDKLSHGDAIALSQIATPDDVNVSFSFKYSNMRFERFNFAEQKYKRVTDRFNNVQQVQPWEAKLSSFAGTGKPIAHGIYGADFELTKSENASIISLDGIPVSVPTNITGQSGRNATTGAEGRLDATPPPTDLNSGLNTFNDLQASATALAPETPAGSPESGGGSFLDKLKSNQKISNFLANSNVGNQISPGGATTEPSPNPTNNIMGKLSQTLFKSSNTPTTQGPAQAGQFKLIQDSIGKINTSFLKNQNTSSSSANDIVSSNSQVDTQASSGGGNDSRIKDALGKFGGDSLASKFKF